MQNFSSFMPSRDPRLARNPNVMTAGESAPPVTASGGTTQDSLNRAAALPDSAPARGPRGAVGTPQAPPKGPKGTKPTTAPADDLTAKGEALLAKAPFLTAKSQSSMYAAAATARSRAVAGAATGSY